MEAAYNYYPDNASQLPLMVGDVVTVVKENSNGWWVVKNTVGECGLVPKDVLVPRVSGVGSPLRRCRTTKVNFAITVPADGGLATSTQSIESQDTTSADPASPSKRIQNKSSRLDSLKQEIDSKRQKLQNLVQQHRVAKKVYEEAANKLRVRKEDMEDVEYKFEELNTKSPNPPVYPKTPMESVAKAEEEHVVPKYKEKSSIEEQIMSLTRELEQLSDPSNSAAAPPISPPSAPVILQAPPKKLNKRGNQAGENKPPPPIPPPKKTPTPASETASKQIIRKKIPKQVIVPVDPIIRKIPRVTNYITQAQQYCASLTEELQVYEDRIQSIMNSIEEAEKRLATDKNAAKLTSCEKDNERLRFSISQTDAKIAESTTHVQNVEAVIAKLARHTTKMEKKLTEAKAANQELQANAKSVSAEVEALRADSSGESAQLESIKAESIALKAEIDVLIKKVEEAAAGYKVELQTVTQAYKKEEQRRRELYNELQELKGNIRVYCRLKPRSSEDQSDYIKIYDATTLDVYDEVSGRDARYEFDLVLPEDASQESIFEEVKPLAVSILDGYHVCIFAYGQTGSGKTYTMEGPPHNRGVNFRAVDELFRIMEARHDDYTYSAEVSVTEVYNDEVYDLQNKRSKLEIRHSEKTGVVIEGLVKLPARTTDDVVRALQEAYSLRVAKSTSMNVQSSRSHCIVSLYITGVNTNTAQKVSGKLHMIDLAGSERIKQSEVTGDKFKEATCINVSLTTLGRVIRSLAAKGKERVPYRDSKLTFLLQDSLGGNCKCLMFANCSVANSNITETISTLKFATNARKVELGKAVAHKS